MPSWTYIACIDGTPVVQYFVLDRDLGRRVGAQAPVASKCALAILSDVIPIGLLEMLNGTAAALA